MTSLIINGISGKMGQAVAAAAEQNGFSICAGADQFQTEVSPWPLYEDLAYCTQKAEVVIDFSRPAALEGLLSYCLRNGCGAVIATTGFAAEDLAKIREASKHVPIFMSANMSLGVNMVLDLICRAAKVLGEQYDIEIIEKHHNQKIDAPSGTALMMADAINEVFNGEKQYVHGRSGTPGKRDAKEIGIHAVRGGTVVGEHEISFFGRDEVISIKHCAQSRALFAGGALRAARFIVGKPPGMYSMKELFSE